MFSKLLGRKSKKPLANPRVPEATRVYAVGDIHGRLDLARKMHDLIRADAESLEGLRKVVVYLGDYIDRGTESREVVDFLIDEPLLGFENVYLRGNHEDSLLKFLKDTSIGPAWMFYGGDATLYSYGVSLPGAIRDQRALDQIQAYLKRNLSERHLDFFNSLQYYHVEGDYYFVHAGVAPGLPLDEQDQQDMMWIREEFLGSTHNFGKVIVHGHTISPVPDIRANRIGIDTGAFSTGVLTCLVLQDDVREFLRT